MNPRPLALLTLLATGLEAHAYQTEISVQGRMADYNIDNIMEYESSDASFHIDYAFTPHITGEAPLAESQFFRPQSHIYLRTGQFPTITVFKHPQPAVFGQGDTFNITDTGGNYHFLDGMLFVGGNYRRADLPDDNYHEYTFSTGVYPVDGLRLQLDLNRSEVGDTNFNSGRLGARYLAKLGDKAIANELSYITTDDRFDAYTVAWDGAFYFTRTTSVLYGLQNMRGRDSGYSVPAINLGLEHFFTETTTFRFVYAYHQIRDDDISENFDWRTVDLSMTVRF